VSAFRRLDECPSFAALLAGSPKPEVRADAFRAAFDGERVRSREIPAGGGLSWNWAAMDVLDGELPLLARLAAEQECVAKYRELASGAFMNTGENRMVLHHLARGVVAGRPAHAGKDLRDFYEGERARFSAFAGLVRSGALRGATGKKFATVVQIGIGGSDLGPRALHIALSAWAKAAGRLGLEARFVSNVDPDDANATLDGLDLESTLFVLVSKSGTTQETLANESLAKAKLEKAGLPSGKHLVAVTSETSPLARNPGYLDSFYIDDFIGGRYSASSAVGGVVLSLAFGPETFAEFLAGAHEADLLALEPDPMKNAALLDALLGVLQRNVLGRPTVAVLPYSQALSRFAAHLQQLDMESNGKRVDRSGAPLAYATGPVVFGEPGTNGQHSFYQLLHQGTDTVPLEFVGFLEGQTSEDVLVEGSTSRRKLAANLAAQIVAFALGKDDADANKRFPGGRPSSLIRGKALDPRALGALLAHFENKVMFQGFLWNLNSFDQEGVQLGKVLTKQVLGEGPLGSALEAYADLLGARA